MYRTKLLFSRKQCFKMALKIYWSVKTQWYWSTGIEVARSCFYLSRRKRTLFFCKTILSDHSSLHCFLRCLCCLFFPPSITFPVLWRLENECWDSCGLKGNGSERVDTWEGRKGLVSTVFKNGGRFRVMKFEPLCCSPPISSYMASQRLKTFKNNYSMWWVNVRLFLSSPSIKQPLCNSFYSRPTSSGGVTSTLVLHPLDLIKIRFQGKMSTTNNLVVCNVQ